MRHDAWKWLGLVLPRSPKNVSCRVLVFVRAVFIWDIFTALVDNDGETYSAFCFGEKFPLSQGFDMNASFTEDVNHRIIGGLYMARRAS